MNCPTCHNRGIIYKPQIVAGRHGSLELCRCIQGQCRCRGRAPFFYWDDNSHSRECPCRSYRIRLRFIQQAFRTAEIPDKFRFQFRQDFLDRAPDGTPIARARKVRSYIEQLANSKEPPHRGLFLHGPPGTGKTLLGCILLNELMLHRGRPGRFVSLTRGYFQRLRDTFSEDSEQHGQAYQILEELVQVPYVVLDDLGIQRGTEWEEEVLYDLVDGRYSEERFTIVTTNQPLEEIQRISRGRIYSRLVEMCHLIEMEGPDWRKEFYNGAK